MFTPGLDQVIHAIAPGARPSGRASFPPDLPDGGARRRGGETAQQWLRRCVNDHFGGDVGRVSVEDNLALLLVVHWDRSAVRYVSVQALWADGPLDRFVGGDGTEAHRYLRLDYDPGALGPLLKEPLPHVHVEADGEPRFPIPLSASDDVIGWFLDFLYRNFYYDDWSDWAEQTWNNWCLETYRENRWVRLVEAFKQSAIGIFEADAALRGDVAELKRCLVEARRRRPVFPLAAIPAVRQLLSHEASVAGADPEGASASV